MKIIILSAGRGIRMNNFTLNTPKCLLDLGNGMTVIESQLENIKLNPEVAEIILVLGYLAEQVESKILKYKKEMNIKIIFNPFFDISNNLISLWMAKHEMTDDFIILNGDDIFHNKILKKLIENKNEGICVVISKKPFYKTGDMKVLIENNRILKISKGIEINKASGESIGMIKISGSSCIKKFKSTIENMVRDKNNLNVFYLEVLNVLSEEGYPINYIEVNPEDWAEIDFHIDLETVKQNFSKYFEKIRRWNLHKYED